MQLSIERRRIQKQTAEWYHPATGDDVTRVRETSDDLTGMNEKDYKH